MCQLTFCHFKNPNYTRIFSTISIIHNSYVINHDGWGIFAGGRTFRTALNAQLTNDIGSIVLDEHIKTSPIICHVRAASTGAKVCVNNSHPFETENFILMHNGTLIVKKKYETFVDAFKKEMKVSPDIIDSEVFTLLLENNYSIQKDFIKTITETMSMFGGKFAFLIYFKPTSTYYIIRGKTADLHVVTFMKDDALLGLVVNTDKAVLEKTINLFRALVQTTGDSLQASEIQELDKETIYRYQANKLIKVAELKEEERETAPFQYGNYGMYPKKNYYMDGGVDNEETIDKSLFKRTSNFMSLYNLSLEDMDKLLFFTMGKGIIRTTEQELRDFLNRGAHKFTISKDFRKEINKILSKNKSPYVPFRFYVESKFQFPYMLIRLPDEQKRFIKELKEFMEDFYA